MRNLTHRLPLFLLLMAILQLPLLVQAQKKYKTHGHKCPRVAITDPGELYSTYEFTTEDEETLKLNEGLGEDLTQLVLDGSRESSEAWPEGMRTLDSRIDNPEILKQYKAFEVAELGEMLVVVIPAKFNANMPKGFAPSEDFYLLISNKGIE
jgi:hypothetical protein